MSRKKAVEDLLVTISDDALLLISLQNQGVLPKGGDGRISMRMRKGVKKGKLMDEEERQQLIEEKKLGIQENMHLVTVILEGE